MVCRLSWWVLFGRISHLPLPILCINVADNLDIYRETSTMLGEEVEFHLHVFSLGTSDFQVSKRAVYYHNFV